MASSSIVVKPSTSYSREDDPSLEDDIDTCDSDDPLSKAIEDFHEQEAAIQIISTEQSTTEKATKERIASVAGKSTEDDDWEDIEECSVEKICDEKPSQSEEPRKRKRGRPRLRDCDRWTDREMFDFAAAIQRFGLGETENIASAVRTKDENAVKRLIKKELTKARSKLNLGTDEQQQGLNTVDSNPVKARISSDARNWAKIAQKQMLSGFRHSDYSRIVMPQIWERFRDDEPVAESPEQLDTRAIYSYVLDCMKGEHAPRELGPKESGAVIMMLRLLREAKAEMDLGEEMDFIRNFKKATTFLPFKGKEEVSEKIDKGKTPKTPVAVDIEDIPTDAVPVPEELFSLLSRHKKLMQSFNPLSIPLWLLEKHSDFMEHMFDEQSED